MGLFNKLFGKHSGGSPDSVTFDVSRYAYQGVRDGAKIWHTTEGDGLGIYFIQRKPDIPSGLASTLELRDFYASKLGDKFRVIECKVVACDGVWGVWFITGGPDQQTGGAIYVGSLTIPFQEFSFVIKMQARERGTTGMREAILVAQTLQNGTATMENGQFVPKGWSFDDQQFDHLLPQHPLSCLRRELRSIAESVKIDENVKAEAPFDLPPDAV